MFWLAHIRSLLTRRAADAPPPEMVCPVNASSSPHETTPQRLQRLGQWCLEGRLAAAEVELHEWQRHADCPTAARTLLSALLARRGMTDDARQILHAAGELDAPAAVLQAALLIVADLPDAARRCVSHLDAHHGDDGWVRQWIGYVEAPCGNELPQVSPAVIEQLAADLLAQPLALLSLVAALKVAPDAEQVLLLRRAGARAYHDLHEGRRGLVLCQAMADLALLAQDADDARRWAHRGLKLEPYSAPLALVLAAVEDDPAQGPPAVNVLAEVAHKHPDYPDVLAALIRREGAQGRREAARRRLTAWLSREPRNLTARRLHQELAA